ncbi:MAG: class I SAM-dependent methyltransferase [Candidatus Caenarcaniphilales bacterium]|nr:class I SAM-dependent methyltransferase [Candidatus Caenarcaniphilales bacterium]
MKSQFFNLKQLLGQTLEYQTQNRRGAFPYEHYSLLGLLCHLKQPKRILELGTAMGLSAITMALASPETMIDTIDKNEEIRNIAKEKAKEFKVFERINFIHSTFKDALPGLKQEYDLIFFDGFAPDLELFMQFESKLKPGGLMVSANLTLGRDSESCIQRMKNPEFYQHFFYFDDTGVAVRV